MDLLCYRDFFKDLFNILRFKEYLRLMHTCKFLHNLGLKLIPGQRFLHYPRKNGLMIDVKRQCQLTLSLDSTIKSTVIYKLGMKKLSKLNGFHLRYSHERKMGNDIFTLLKVGWYTNGTPNYVLFLNIKPKKKTTYSPIRSWSKYKINYNGKIRNSLEGELETFADKVSNEPLVKIFLLETQKENLYQDIMKYGVFL